MEQKDFCVETEKNFQEDKKESSLGPNEIQMHLIRIDQSEVVKKYQTFQELKLFEYFNCMFQKMHTRFFDFKKGYRYMISLKNIIEDGIEIQIDLNQIDLNQIEKVKSWRSDKVYSFHVLKRENEFKTIDFLNSFNSQIKIPYLEYFSYPIIPGYLDCDMLDVIYDLFNQAEKNYPSFDLSKYNFTVIPTSPAYDSDGKKIRDRRFFVYSETDKRLYLVVINTSNSKLTILNAKCKEIKIDINPVYEDNRYFEKGRMGLLLESVVEIDYYNIKKVIEDYLNKE